LERKIKGKKTTMKRRKKKEMDSMICERKGKKNIFSFFLLSGFFFLSKVKEKVLYLYS
jgi:hypothetical protein